MKHALSLEGLPAALLCACTLTYILLPHTASAAYYTQSSYHAAEREYTPKPSTPSTPSTQSGNPANSGGSQGAYGSVDSPRSPSPSSNVTSGGSKVGSGAGSSNGGSGSNSSSDSDSGWGSSGSGRNGDSQSGYAGGKVETSCNLVCLGELAIQAGATTVKNTAEYVLAAAKERLSVFGISTPTYTAFPSADKPTSISSPYYTGGTKSVPASDPSTDGLPEPVRRAIADAERKRLSEQVPGNTTADQRARDWAKANGVANNEAGIAAAKAAFENGKNEGDLNVMGAQKFVGAATRAALLGDNGGDCRGLGVSECANYATFEALVGEENIGKINNYLEEPEEVLVAYDGDLKELNDDGVPGIAEGEYDVRYENGIRILTPKTLDPLKGDAEQVGTKETPKLASQQSGFLGLPQSVQQDILRSERVIPDLIATARQIENEEKAYDAQVIKDAAVRAQARADKAAEELQAAQYNFDHGGGSYNNQAKTELEAKKVAFDAAVLTLEDRKGRVVEAQKTGAIDTGFVPEPAKPKPCDNLFCGVIGLYNTVTGGKSEEQKLAEQRQMQQNRIAELAAETQKKEVERLALEELEKNPKLDSQQAWFSGLPQSVREHILDSEKAAADIKTTTEEAKPAVVVPPTVNQEIKKYQDIYNGITTDAEITKEEAYQKIQKLNSKQYTAGRIAAADASYKKAEEDIVAALAKCKAEGGDCSKIPKTPVAVPGVQGFWSIPTTLKTPDTTETIKGKPTDDQKKYEDIGKPFGLTSTEEVAALLLMAEEFKKKRPEGFEGKTVEEAVRGTLKLMKVEIIAGAKARGGSVEGDPETLVKRQFADIIAGTDTVKACGLFGICGSVTDGMRRTMIATDQGLFKNDGTPDIDKVTPDMVKKATKDQKDAIAAKALELREQLKDKTIVIPGKTIVTYAAILTPEQRKLALGIDPAADAAATKKINDVAFAEYNKLYPETPSNTKEAPFDFLFKKGETDTTIGDRLTSIGKNAIELGQIALNPHLEKAEVALTQAERAMTEAREKARGSAVDSQAMFVYSKALGQFQDAQEALKKAQEAAAAKDLATLDTEAQKAKKLADESVILGRSIGTQDRWSESGIAKGPIKKTEAEVLQDAVEYLWEEKSSHLVSVAAQASAKELSLGVKEYALEGTDPKLVIQMAEAFRRMKAEGLNPMLNSAYRDTDHQATLTGVAAKPGESWHQRRAALDISGGTYEESQAVYDWIDKNGKELGLVRPYADIKKKDGSPFDDPHTVLANSLEVVNKGRDPNGIRQMSTSEVEAAYQKTLENSTGGTGVKLTVDFDAIIKAGTPTKEPATVITYKEAVYNTLEGWKNKLFPTIPEDPIVPDDPTGDGDTDTKPTLAETAGCVVNALSSFNVGAAGGCFGGGGGGNGGGNNNTDSLVSGSGSGSGDDTDNSKPIKPGKPAKDPVIIPQTDITIVATQATQSTTTQYRFGGLITRTYDSNSNGNISVEDLQKNLGAIITNKLNVDYLCDGTVDGTKTFTTPYHSFAADDMSSSVLISEYFPVTVAGTHCFSFETDTTNVITEKSESNNKSNQKVFVRG